MAKNMTQTKIEIGRIGRFVDELEQLEEMLGEHEVFKKEFEQILKSAENLRNDVSLLKAVIYEHCE